MKSYTSRSLRKAITQHSGESRKEEMLWMMRRAGIKNGNNNDRQLWQKHNKPLEILNIQVFYQKPEYIHVV